MHVMQRLPSSHQAAGRVRFAASSSFSVRGRQGIIPGSKQEKQPKTDACLWQKLEAERKRVFWHASAVIRRARQHGSLSARFATP